MSNAKHESHFATSTLNKRNFLKGIGAFSVANCSLTRALAQAKATPYSVNMTTASLGSGSYVLGSAFEQIVNASTDKINLHATSTAGAVYNIKRIYSLSDEDRKHEVAVYLPMGNELATIGDKFFAEKRKPLKILNNYLIGGYWLATLDKDIKTIEDIKRGRKKVGLGRTAAISWGLKPGILLTEGYGVDKGQLSYIGQQDAVQAVLDGKLDVTIVGGYYNPLENKVELSPQTLGLVNAGRGVYHIGLPEEGVKKVNQGGAVMLSMSYPKGAIPGVDGDLEVYGNRLVWAVSEDFPEEIAYELVKIAVQNYSKFKDYTAVGKLFSPEMMVYKWGRDALHPGAVRAYDELGVAIAG